MSVSVIGEKVDERTDDSSPKVTKNSEDWLRPLIFGSVLSERVDRTFCVHYRCPIVPVTLPTFAPGGETCNAGVLDRQR
jgi:hypothetical protein